VTFQQRPAFASGLRDAETVTEKAPEQSGKADATKNPAQADRRRWCGDPVQARRRPGGTDLALIGQGSQTYLSLPPSCQGVSETKARQIRLTS